MCHTLKLSRYTLHVLLNQLRRDLTSTVVVVVNDSVSLVVSRPAFTELVSRISSSSGLARRLPPPALRALANFILDRLQPRLISFEEQVFNLVTRLSFAFTFKFYCYNCSPSFCIMLWYSAGGGFAPGARFYVRTWRRAARSCHRSLSDAAWEWPEVQYYLMKHSDFSISLELSYIRCWCVIYDTNTLKSTRTYVKCIYSYEYALDFLSDSFLVGNTRASSSWAATSAPPVSIWMRSTEWAPARWARWPCCWRAPRRSWVARRCSRRTWRSRRSRSSTRLLNSLLIASPLLDCPALINYSIALPVRVCSVYSVYCTRTVYRLYRNRADVFGTRARAAVSLRGGRAALLRAVALAARALRVHPARAGAARRAQRVPPARTSLHGARARRPPAHTTHRNALPRRAHAAPNASIALFPGEDVSNSTVFTTSKPLLKFVILHGECYSVRLRLRGSVISLIPVNKVQLIQHSNLLYTVLICSKHLALLNFCLSICNILFEHSYEHRFLERLIRAEEVKELDAAIKSFYRASTLLGTTSHSETAIRVLY